MISIIMPVYNMQRLLDKSIESVIAQNYTDWELIIVDDGSTDNSYNIAKKFSENDKRIKVYKQINSGVSVARNLGLRMAMGEWCLFLDSDDCLEIGLFEKVAQNIEEDDRLFVFCYKKEIYDNNQLCSVETTMQEGKKGQCDLIGMPDNMGDILTTTYFFSPFAKLYKRKIIEEKNIRFSSSCVFGEDTKFNFDYLLYVSEFKMLHEDMYLYRCEKGEDKRIKYRYRGPAFESSNLVVRTVEKYANETNKEKGDIYIGFLLGYYYKEAYCYIKTCSRQEKYKKLRDLLKNKTFRSIQLKAKGKTNYILKIFIAIKFLKGIEWCVKRFVGQEVKE